MTRSEAEEIFIGAIMSEETVAIEISQNECQVFRVLVGRALKEMEHKNRALWLRARDYGVEYKAPYAIIRKLDPQRYKLFTVSSTGEVTPLVRPLVEEGEVTNFGIAGKEESDDK
jgi:hypothetical protein